MKTRLRNIGIALIFAVTATGANAHEIRNIADIASEPKVEIENWMTDWTVFEAKKNDSSRATIVDVAGSKPDFSILVEAVAKADLVSALSADGPFTVFAPNNEAFNALFKDLGVSGISDLTKEQLTPILTYHVVSGKIMSDDLMNTSVSTLNGKSIKVDINNGVSINDSKVVAADITGANGVIHVVDKVLMPETKADLGCSN